MQSSIANAKAVLGFTETTWSDTYPYIDPRGCDLHGRSVFITGASRGVGKATAISYAKAGANKIAIAARSNLSPVVHEIKEAARRAGHKMPNVIAVQVDVTSEQSVKAAAKLVQTEFDGKLDILVCNAGTSVPWHLIGETEPDEWWNTFEVNIKGPYLCARFFIPLLLKGDLKTAIITASFGSIYVVPGSSAFVISKLATCRLAEFIATEYEQHGLVAMAFHPGSILTEQGKKMPEEMHNFITDTTELGADTTVWLTKESRPWLSGRLVHAKWDMEELERKKDQIFSDRRVWKDDEKEVVTLVVVIELSFCFHEKSHLAE
ncbi:NAD(P)-binding protein [Paramyrothecium foliicola]|nr:NAD(P)-binding protein [Paramyrothecium foliicola]